MQVLGPANPAPTEQELIAQCGKAIAEVMTSEMADEADVDRIWILRKLHKNLLYYRDLAYFAPSLYQGLVDATGIDGTLLPDASWQGTGLYDYTQNIYRGYCRKLCAVLGTRIPNAIAVPNDPTDEADIKAARAANNAAQYIRQHCDLQVMILWLVFKLYNFGTCFWNIEWVEDPDKYGYKEVPADSDAEQAQLGGNTQCPQCGALNDPGSQTCESCGAPLDQATAPTPFSVPVPGAPQTQSVPKGALEIDILDCSEVSVPLDTDGRRGVEDVSWLRRERERHKSIFLQKYGDALREPEKREGQLDDQSASAQYSQSVRSAMASPIGIVRPKRENQWTELTEEWPPRMYELIKDKAIRQALKENFKDGLKITAVKGVIVGLKNRKLQDHWQECQPEPTQKMICEPLGDDWVVTQDILNNILNQCNETLERSNEPGFADPTRVDLDAYQRRRSEPLDLIPALRPAGGTLADLVFRPQPPQFSEQIPPFRAQVEQTSQQNSGLLEVIWGGDTSDPTARQTELKTNAAIRQLSVIWVMIGKSLERVYEKGCHLLAEHEDGVLAFSKEKADQYGKYDTVAVVIEDLKGGEYHFEADEAIPMTWGQQRDLLMWLLDKPPEILTSFGISDPLNVPELKELLGMPGMRIPHLDARDKVMDVISRLLEAQPQPGQPGPDGSPGQPQSSIQPDWEDDADFHAKLVQAYLTTNYELAEKNPQGYQNVQLYGQACQQKANQPAPPPPPKSAVTVALKGSDIGNNAITAGLQKVGIIPPGTQTEIQPPPLKPGQMPPPSNGMMPPPGSPAPSGNVPSA